jgi:hypothetical protein
MLRADNLKRLLNIKGKPLKTLFRSLRMLQFLIKKDRKSILPFFSPEPYSTPKN